MSTEVKLCKHTNSKSKAYMNLICWQVGQNDHKNYCTELLSKYCWIFSYNVWQGITVKLIGISCCFFRLSVALLVLLMGGIMRLFFPYSDALEWCLSVGGALVFSLFIVFDTSLIMHKVSPEEYIMACINLYLDIINLFLHLLRILSKSQKQ